MIGDLKCGPTRKTPSFVSYTRYKTGILGYKLEF